MKKTIKIILVLLVIIVFFQLISFIFKTKHNITYNVINNDLKFIVKENYYKGLYHLEISNNNYKFSYYMDDEFYKSKKVLNDVLYVKDDNMLCVYPLFKKNNYLNITCSDGKNNYAYESVKTKQVVKDFVSKLNDKYDNKSWINTDKSTKTMGYIKIYNDNIDADEYIYIWKYNGFYSINKKEQQVINLFKNDNYNNDLGVLVDKYYLIPNYDQNYNYSNFYVLNIVTNKKKSIRLENKISSYSYYNGVVNNKVYLTDKNNLKQYAIDVRKRKFKEIGNKNDNGLLYKNKKFEEINIYDLVKKEISFAENLDIVSKVKDFGYDSIYFNDNLYYLMKDNQLYSYDEQSDIFTLLFKLNNVTNIKFVGNTIYFIKDDTLYSYDNNGLKKLVLYDELKYNNKNIYSVYKK